MSVLMRQAQAPRAVAARQPAGLRRFAVPGSRRWTPSFWLGSSLVALWLITAALAPALAPFPPNQVLAGPALAPPDSVHPFGTDLLGRDLLSRVLYGGRVAVAMAAGGVTLALVLGTPLGLLAGYNGRRLDHLLSRVMEVWMAFPGLLLAIIIVARLGPSLVNTVLALGVVGAPGYFRLVRNMTLSARHAPHVEAARALGARNRRILLRHIAPSGLPALIVLATARMGALILAGGALSFIGLGAQPPLPEWGALLASGRDAMAIAPWLAILPGVCITLTVAGLNLMGDGLRDAVAGQGNRSVV